MQEVTNNQHKEDYIVNTQRAHATAENCIKHIILISYMCDTVSAKLSQPICMNASIKPL